MMVPACHPEARKQCYKDSPKDPPEHTERLVSGLPQICVANFRNDELSFQKFFIYPSNFSKYSLLASNVACEALIEYIGF